MSNILLIRHGLSIGNEKGIIQGNKDFSLSKNGVDKINNIDISKYNIDFNRIITSPTLRAKETASIINKKLNKELEEDAMLMEVSAGILDGKSKEECRKQYSDMYEIYSKRGDYNNIPGADTWNYNQARAITFLERYMNNESNDIVVSHAAFMRCLINLIQYKDRNTQHDIPNCSEFLLKNPLENIGIHQFEIARSSRVWEIDTYDSKYIMKRKENNIEERDLIEKDILDYLGEYMDAPNIILMSNREDYQIKIMKFLEGYHIFGDLNQTMINKINDKVYKMSKILESYDTKKLERMSIIDELKSCKNVLIDEKALDELNNLITDQNFINYLKSSKYIPVHNDLHRSNILISNDDIKIIDFESVKLYPKELQLATYICSSYLLENPNISLDYIINNWPENVDKKITLKLIKYRLLYGMSFFDNIIRENRQNEEDLKIKQKYVRALGGIINERNNN